MITLAEAENALIKCAQACEKCLRIAAFSDTETSLGEPITELLRRFASMHSENAFDLSRVIVRMRASA